MKKMTVEQIDQRLEELGNKTSTLFERYPDHTTIPANQVKELTAWNEEMRELTYRKRFLQDDRAPVNRVPFAKSDRYDSKGILWQAGAGQKSIGDQVIDSDAFKAFLNAPQDGPKSLSVPVGDIERKALTLSTFEPQSVREDLILPTPLRPLRVADLFSQGVTDQNSVKYMQETTFTNAAAEVSEGGLKQESDLAFEEKTAEVRKIATWIPATKEVLDDIPGLRDYINDRLPMMIQQREDSQLLVGNGTAPNISGILDQTDLQTQAKGADPAPDAIYKGAMKVWTSQFLEPDAIVIHPNDWTSIRLLRTADGLYIFGAPTESDDRHVFGLRVVVTPAITEGTALVGAFKLGARVVRRENLIITMSTEHEDYFTHNKVAILAEERLAFPVYRPSAFCQITGI